jgi:bacteriocin-like protein
MTKKDNKNELADRMPEVPKNGFEITDDELAQIAGGLAARVSKTIDLVVGCTDMDDPF